MWSKRKKVLPGIHAALSAAVNIMIPRRRDQARVESGRKLIEEGPNSFECFRVCLIGHVAAAQDSVDSLHT